MAKACKCDICRKLFEERLAIPDLCITKYTHGYGDTRLDLCEGCQEKLENFVNNGGVFTK